MSLVQILQMSPVQSKFYKSSPAFATCRSLLIKQKQFERFIVVLV